MKEIIVLFLILAVVVVSGCTVEPTQEEIVFCSTDNDCICGNIIGKDQCYVGNRGYIEPSDKCFITCFGDTSKGAKCIDNECEWVSMNKEDPDSPVAEIVHDGIEEGRNSAAITVKNTGPVPFTPSINLVIIANNLTVYDDNILYDTIGTGEFQTKYISIPGRDVIGDWVYEFTLSDADGNVIKQMSEAYQKNPPPILSGYMMFSIKPQYRYINNILVGAKNSGDFTFIPEVRMTIYESDMSSIYSVSNVYSSLDPGDSENFNFILPPIENRTYYFNFILLESQNKTILEEITHEVLIGT